MVERGAAAPDQQPPRCSSAVSPQPARLYTRHFPSALSHNRSGCLTVSLGIARCVLRRDSVQLSCPTGASGGALASGGGASPGFPLWWLFHSGVFWSVVGSHAVTERSTTIPFRFSRYKPPPGDGLEEGCAPGPETHHGMILQVVIRAVLGTKFASRPGKRANLSPAMTD